MAMNKYFSIPFNAGVRQDIPRSLLPLPFLTKAENLITRDEGRLENRPHFRRVSNLPPNTGNPLKLFTYNQGLYCFTDRYLLVYEKSSNKWKDLRTNLEPSSNLAIVRNIGSKVYPLVQKERDITTLAFEQFTDNTLVFFYTYNPSPFAVGTIFYNLFSIADKRFTEQERQLNLYATDRPTGVYAYRNSENEFWVGVSYASRLRIIRFNPVMEQTEESFVFNVAGVQRFRIYKDRIFYTLDGRNVQSVLFNSDATEKATASELSISDLRNPSAHSVGFSNQTLYDFKDWVEFQYNDEDYKMVWSLDTGYFLINENNRLVSHLYANLLPEAGSSPPRVRYSGRAVVVGEKVYVPVLRSGQVEVVNRDAVNDRIIPTGRQELVAFRPLGLDLVEFDMESQNPPDVAQIGKQLLISGPVLKWSGGVSLTEYSFTEKPTFTKTTSTDYRRWPYLNIDQNLPSTQELNRTQFTDLNINMERKGSPYLVNTLNFTAGSSGANIGVGQGYGSWSADSPVSNRTLRYSSRTNAVTPQDSYQGILTYLYYDNNEKAIIGYYTSAPTSLQEGRDHPQGIVINGVNYPYHSVVLTGRVLVGYHYMSDSPLVSGSTYTVNQPYADILRTASNTNQRVQVGNDDNQNTNIYLNDIRFRKFSTVSGTSTPTTTSGDIINTSSVGFATLNDDNHVGAFKANLAQTVGANVRLPGGFISDSSKEINFRGGGITGGATDGTTLWFVRHRDVSGLDDDLEAFTIGSGVPTRNTAKDVTLPENADWRGACSDGTTMWVLNSHLNPRPTMIAYTIGTGRPTRNSSKDFNLARGTFDNYNYRGCVSDGTTIWVVYNDSHSQGSNRAVAYTIGTGTPTRNSSKDINLGGRVQFSDWQGAFTDNTTLWFITQGPNRAVAYTIGTGRPTRDSGKDFTIGQIGDLSGGVFSGDTLWVTGSAHLTTKNFRRQSGAINNDAVGTITNKDVLTNIELSAIWSDRSKLYLVFGAETSAFSTGQAIETELSSKVNDWTYVLGNSRFNSLNETISSSDTKKTYYTAGGFAYVRYEMADFPTSSLLRNIILDNNVLGSSRINIEFKGADASGILFEEGRGDLEPEILSVIYSTFDGNNAPKTVRADDINNNITIHSLDNPGEFSDFLFDDSTFEKVQGPVSANNYYSFHTTGNPLIVNSEVLNFDSLSIRVRVVYPLVRTVPELTPERLLEAKIYNYKCRYKWLDENGIEHRSQYSDILQIASTQHIGIEGNQPSFNVGYLNLTNKEEGSVAIEIYRTKNLSTTFQFVREVQSSEFQQQAVFTDDVLDASLGAPAGNDNIVVSGSEHVLPYQGRFVLYGFPDKPNRILISSAENPFSNQAVPFQQQGLATDVIEILLEQDIKGISVLDNYLIIFGETQAYTWALREGTFSQGNPAVITGLASYTLDNLQSSVETTEGLMFNADRGRGIQLLSRGLTWNFRGESVKKATTAGKVLSSFRKDENVYFFKERNPNEPNQPQVLVYNQRYKTWTSYTDEDLVYGVIWDNKLTALVKSDTGESSIWQEDGENVVSPQDENLVLSQPAVVFKIESGWLNLTNALVGYQRLRDIYLLGEFTGLEQLSLTIDYDFIPGHRAETINFDLSGYTDSPDISVVRAVVGPSLRDKREFRFQPRHQGGTAIRLAFKIIARTAKLDALRLGGDWDRIAGTQTQRSSQRSGNG